MARILGYIAASLDGYIAGPNDSLDWLFKYDTTAFGEDDPALFLARIRTLVMGRGTYDWLIREGGPWPYEGKRVYVVTSRALAAPEGVDIIARSDIDALIAELRALPDGDAWMLGGGRLQMAFMERGALDEIEIYVIPELLGGGVPLFPPTGFAATVELVSARPSGPGCVRLHYRLSSSAAGAR
ncbi:Dihydrofolate reductase [Devosia enhydra]|uniref:Dihydrofolate reductase n=1 Tax=Devosia enhydra TaxID=665118 RepID=A0A1K2HT28_9HYPH|nr:dihydrofolate reductase family protein [Devosia enhydra]SFZ81005.1 Dihydrofolate reductase [Devosia enhydra]